MIDAFVAWWRRSVGRPAGLREEVRFFRSLLDGTNADQRFVDLFHDLARTEHRLQPHFEELLRHVPEGSLVRILDVGSGPITQVGTRCERWRLEITAVDPLADEYVALRQEFGLDSRGVRYQRGEAESLATAFAGKWFDIVYCRNALDHTRSPLEGIRQMVRVCKDDGSCLLSHSTDEGDKQRYRGLHQWNFSPQDDGDVIVHGRGGHAVSLRRELDGVATVQATKHGDWHNVLVRPVPTEHTGAGGTP